MNKERRKRLDYVISQLESLQEEVSSLAEEEQMAYDNLPDNLYDTDMANQLSDNAYDLESANGEIESLLDFLREIAER